MLQVTFDEFERIVILVRHGEALSKQEDPARPLSDRGRNRAETTARWLASIGLPVGEIRHSGKARARETAEIVAAALDAGERVREAEGLAPNDDTTT